MLVPLYGFLAGDTLGLIILAQDTDTMDQVVASVQRAACMRVAPRSGGSVWVAGRRLDRRQTVAGAGLTALDRIDVVPEGPLLEDA